MDIESKKERKFKIDIFLIVPAVILVIIGIVTLLSTTIEPNGAFGDLSIVKKQILFAVIGFVLYIILTLIDFSWMKYW